MRRGKESNWGRGFLQSKEQQPPMKLPEGGEHKGALTHALRSWSFEGEEEEGALASKRKIRSSREGQNPRRPEKGRGTVES